MIHLGIKLENQKSFSPRDISGLFLWLRSDLGVTVGGGSVSAWADQSGNGRNFTQGTTAKQPLFINSGINGLPALRFDGVDDILKSSSFTLSPPFTVFIVMNRITALAGAYYTCGLSENYGVIYQPGGGFGLYNGVVFTTAAPSVGSNVVATCVFNGAGSQVWLNGISATGPGNAGVLSPLTGMCLGGYFAESVNFFSNFYLAEIIIYNRTLAGSSDRVSVETYLKNRYAIS